MNEINSAQETPGIVGIPAQPASGVKPVAAGVSFEQQLADSRLSFSKHAAERVASRDISIDGNDIKRLGQAVDKAEVKGARNSLVIMDRLALIVNVPSRKVVTAMTGDRLRDGVVTNIDSTVIVNKE